MDPLIGYNPILESEHYIDGEHNGGVFNPMNLNPYTYQNPVVFVDPNGKQNVSGYLVGKILTSPQNGYSNFTKSAIHILNKVSGVDKSLIKNSIVTHSRKENMFLPYYDKIGPDLGALVLPTKKGSTIYYNKGVFSKSITYFMSLSSHEVGHLPQVELKGNDIQKYIGVFINQYIKSGNHDDAPFELSADIGSIRFDGFISFTNRYYGNGAFEELYRNNNSQDNIIATFNQWWEEYKASPEYKKIQEKVKSNLIKAYKNIEK